ncbi:hypothetical protein SLA2020_446190 [Shorea laevis]
MQKKNQKRIKMRKGQEKRSSRNFEKSNLRNVACCGCGCWRSSAVCGYGRAAKQDIGIPKMLVVQLRLREREGCARGREHKDYPDPLRHRSVLVSQWWRMVVERNGS